MAEKTLPNKPSELIRLALGDLEKAEQSPLYAVNMDCWHSPNGDICLVCLAGSVLAFSLEVPPTADYLYMPRVTSDKSLSALNLFRRGYIQDAFDDLCLGESRFENRKIAPYADNRDQFFADMNRLADDLQAAGL